MQNFSDDSTRTCDPYVPIGTRAFCASTDGIVLKKLEEIEIRARSLSDTHCACVH
jgi:hypothetical protein